MLRYSFLALLASLLFAATRTEPSEVTEGFAVVELFTSQGCSSCPPADAVLAELDREARRSGRAVYALSFHVDYWNYLGWADPFSSPHYSARQTDYNERLESRTYTPQLVVNGQTELIGSRRSEVLASVKRALATPAEDYGLTVGRRISGDTMRVAYSLERSPPEGELVVLLVQERATSSVGRGENRGKELHHVGVVRGLRRLTSPAVGVAGQEVALPLPDGVAPAALSVVVLLQAGAGGPVRAVAASR